MDALVGVGAGVDQDVVRLDAARQHLEQADLADMTIDDGLPHPRQGRPGGVGRHLGRLAPRLHQHGRPVEGRRADLADEGGQPVDGDLLDRGPADHREDGRGGYALSERLLQLSDARNLTLEVALHQVVVGHDDPLDQGVVHGVLLAGHVIGDGSGRGAPALVGDGRVRQQVGHAAEAGLLADRQLQGCDAGAEGALQVLQGALEGSPLPVELVDEDETGETQVGGHLPHVGGLHLDALDRADHEDGQVGDGQGGGRLLGEVGVPGASMMLILWPSHSIGARAAEIDRLRLCSSGSKSVTVAASSTRPGRPMAPERCSSASVRVVLPDPPWPTRATLRMAADE